jgi:hypothetical protein
LLLVGCRCCCGAKERWLALLAVFIEIVCRSCLNRR